MRSLQQALVASRRRDRYPAVVFTGIVRGTFAVVERREVEGGERLVVQLDSESAAGLVIGASVAVVGVCLTVVQLERDAVGFDVVPETLNKTRIGELKVGERVNIERSLRAGDELGGHVLSGHVIGTALVQSVNTQGQHQVWLQVAADWRRYLFHKGFVAVDGCSLTIGDVSETGFCVNLIPETLRRTTLGALRQGAKVNIELDSLTVATVGTVERILAARGITSEHG